MLNKDFMKRTTSTIDMKYFFRTEAKWFRHYGQSHGSAHIAVRSEIFEGSPANLGNEPIHVIEVVGETTDLLDSLQTGEAASRQYVAALER